MKYTSVLLFSLIFCSCSRVETPDPVRAPEEQMGTIDFPVSGDTAVRRQLERGIQLLHHMTYDEADEAFSAAIEADPENAIAYWGRAMSIVHPVWPDVPSDSQLKTGWDFIEKARRAKTKTERDSAFIETLAVYFENGWERQEKDRLIALDRAWEDLQERYPKDVEAACFFALFHLAPARFLPPDSSYHIQRVSGSIVEEVLRKIPDHPGALHYQIHAYDYPALADRALEMCGKYSEVAPANAHALHMPTHIYTRTGLWEKSIELNLRSADAAKRKSQQNGGVGVNYLHALDYAVYAYLQRGQYEEAVDIQDTVMAEKGPFAGANLTAGAFAFAAIPARITLENQQWEQASQLTPRKPEWFPWDDRFIPQESMIHYARGIGAARSGNLPAAKEAIQAHAQLANKIAQSFPSTYWEAQSKTQQLAMQGWLAYSENRPEEAVRLLKQSAELESVTEKEAVTPGEVIAAGELYGDLLFELGKHSEAVQAYGRVLERSPNRFYSLYGIGQAAEAAGDTETASRYYEQLVHLGRDADKNSDRLSKAKSFLANR